MEEDIEENLR